MKTKSKNTQNKITMRHGLNIQSIMNNPTYEQPIIGIIEKYCVDSLLEDVRKYVETTITENPKEMIVSITIVSDKPVPKIEEISKY